MSWNLQSEDVIRRFFFAILNDEEHGVLALTKPGSLQYGAVSNVIALLLKKSDDINAWVDVGADAFSLPGPAASVAAHIAAWSEATCKAKTTERWGESRSYSAIAADNVSGAVRAAAEVIAERAKSNAGTSYAAIDARSLHYQWMLNTIIKLVMEGKDEQV